MTTAAENRYSAASAVISGDGLYRYVLHRRWNGGGGKVLTFIGLNPSTADGEADDPTIRRMCGFARREGATGICVLNLFALRSPDPAALAEADSIAGIDPVGPVVAAWGAHLLAEHRSREVLAWLRPPGGGPVMCLGLTASGAPRHPLYLRADAPLVPYGGPS